MPLYEYECSSCGQRFDKMIRFSEFDVRPICPSCGSNETRRQISMIASSISIGASTLSCGRHGHFS